MTTPRAARTGGAKARVGQYFEQLFSVGPHGQKEWYKGRITSHSIDTFENVTFHVDYDDGEIADLSEGTMDDHVHFRPDRDQAKGAEQRGGRASCRSGAGAGAESGAGKPQQKKAKKRKKAKAKAGSGKRAQGTRSSLGSGADASASGSESESDWGQNRQKRTRGGASSRSEPAPTPQQQGTGRVLRRR